MRTPSAWLVVLLIATPCGMARAGEGNPEDVPKVKVITFAEEGPAEVSLDILFVGDGYVKGKGERKFKKDLKRYAKRLLETMPFDSYDDRINIRGAFVPSKDSGCDPAKNEDEADTVLDSCFSTRDGRSLYFQDSLALAHVVNEVGQVDIVFVMVNTERYGGAGTTLAEVTVRGRPLPAPTFAARDTPSFLIAVHEVGHSFADLSDEYTEEGKHDSFPIPDEGDVPSANATLSKVVDDSSFETLKSSLKWGHFLEQKDAKKFAWIHEGAFYRERGVYRPWEICLMRSLDKDFCPVCAEEVSRAIVETCGDTFDDAAWHKQHPLRLWKGKH